MSTVVGFSAAEIARHAAVRPPEWLAELNECIVKRANGWVWVDQGKPQYLAMMAKYKGQPRPPLDVEGPPPTSERPPAERRRSQSRLDPSQWGPGKWHELHTFTLTPDATDPAKLDAFVKAWRAGIPPIGCPCRAELDADLKANPPDAADPFGWGVRRHNRVNRKLGKAELGVEEARTIHQAEGVMGGDRRGVEPASTGN